MSTQDPNQPPQISPDGKWQWDGHNWVPRQPAPAAQGVPAPGPQQYAGGQGQPYAAPQPGYPQYGVPQPGYPAPKKGMPLWGKITIGVLGVVVALVALLTVVGLMVDSNDYSSWSCQDVADKAVTISNDRGGMLVLTDVTDLKVVEDHRKNFTPPKTDRGIVLSCQGTGTWDPLGEAPVTVELSADDSGQEWVRYEMTD